MKKRQTHPHTYRKPGIRRRCDFSEGKCLIVPASQSFSVFTGYSSTRWGVNYSWPKQNVSVGHHVNQTFERRKAQLPTSGAHWSIHKHSYLEPKENYATLFGPDPHGQMLLPICHGSKDLVSSTRPCPCQQHTFTQEFTNWGHLSFRATENTHAYIQHKQGLRL